MSKKYDEWFVRQLELAKEAQMEMETEHSIIIMTALERMIPRKPTGRHTDFRCGKCGTRVRSGQGSSSFIKDTVCRNCLTIIDWRDE